jgi:hypothetical protein
MQDMTMKDFLRERAEVLLSMNKTLIEAYMRKYEIPIPSDDDTFWVAVHMARTGGADLPLSERLISKRWLSERGYQSLDDGELDA